jgi:menaquinone-dependent protoporphyrinogen oxidase
MTRCLVVYVTKEGHTGILADRLSETLRGEGLEADCHEVSHLAAGSTLDAYDAALVCAPVHAGSYPDDMVEFVKSHRGWLESHPAAFVSVSLSAIGHDEEDRAAMRESEESLVEASGWHPARIEHVAGALVYSQYPFFVRQVMKLISRRQGLPTSGDHDYTDYARLDAFGREFARSLSVPAS